MYSMYGCIHTHPHTHSLSAGWTVKRSRLSMYWAVSSGGGGLCDADLTIPRSDENWTRGIPRSWRVGGSEGERGGGIQWYIYLKGLLLLDCPHHSICHFLATSKRFDFLPPPPPSPWHTYGFKKTCKGWQLCMHWTLYTPSLNCNYNEWVFSLNKNNFLSGECGFFWYAEVVFKKHVYL